MKNKAKKSSQRIFLILVVILLTGLSLMLYPIVSEYWNSLHQSRVIATYMETVAELDDDSYEVLWKEAQDYNASLPRTRDRFQPDEEETAI